MARLIEHSSPEQAPAPAPEPESRPWPLVLAGPVAALGAFAISAVVFALPVFAVWLTAADVGPEWDSWPEVAHIAGLAWLLGHGLPVVIADVTITLIPWGLTLLSAGILFVAGRWAARVAAVERPLEALAVAGSAAITYAAAALAVATWIADPATGPGRVIASALALAGVSVFVGVLSGARILRASVAALPAPIRRICASATSAVGVLIVGGGLLLAASMIAYATDSQRLLTALAPDAAGFVALLLISIGYLPTLVMWAVSYLLGMGFTVAEGMVISPFGPAAEGELPLFPLLGALPPQAPPGVQALPIIGLLAGFVAAAMLKRRGARGGVLIGESLASLALAVGALGALLVAATGSLGAERLSALGPDLLPVLGVAALLWAVGYLIIIVPALLSVSDDDGIDGGERSDSPDGYGLRLRTATTEVIDDGQRYP